MPNLQASSDKIDVSLDKKRTSPRLEERCIQTPEDIYELEDDLIKRFKALRDTRVVETKETLGDCFEILMQTDKFKSNYMMVKQDGHHFFLPKYFLQDTAHMVRFKEGKSFVSPLKGNTFQGHHIQMRPPVNRNKPAYIWVLTRTQHQAYSEDLHIDVDESAIDRSEFATVQKRLYKKIHRMLNANDNEENIAPSNKKLKN